MAERTHYGPCKVNYGEVDGLLVTCADGPAGAIWTASRSHDQIAVAVSLACSLDPDIGRVGVSHHSEAAAIRDYRAIERNERIARNEDAGLCHCGHSKFRSDHCPLCGCEEYESYCDTVYHDSPTGRAECECPFHS
jgi:hypothetical protein